MDRDESSNIVSEGEASCQKGAESQSAATTDVAFDAAITRLQAEVDQEAEEKKSRCSNPDPRTHLIALLKAAAELIMLVTTLVQQLHTANNNRRTLIIEADQTWHSISNAVSGQTWGALNSEAKQAVNKLTRDFKIKPLRRSKLGSR